MMIELPNHIAVYMTYYNSTAYQLYLLKLKSKFPRWVVPFFDERGELI